MHHRLPRSTIVSPTNTMAETFSFPAFPEPPRQIRKVTCATHSDGEFFDPATTRSPIFQILATIYSWEAHTLHVTCNAKGDSPTRCQPTTVILND